MVTCPYCQIGFSAGYKCCPICGRFEVPFAERAKHLATEAEAQLEAGESPHTVERMLVANGISEQSATQLVAQGKQKVGKRTRAHGFFRLFAGFGSVVLGSAAFILIFPMIRAKHGLAGREAMLAVGFGSGLIVFGSFAIVSGLLSVTMGRESPVAAPNIVTDLASGDRPMHF
jgi:hypothetical protein